jgi:hypothetical protein
MTARPTSSDEATAAPVPSGLTRLPHQQEGIRSPLIGSERATARCSATSWGAQPHLGGVSGERPIHVAA